MGRIGFGTTPGYHGLTAGPDFRPVWETGSNLPVDGSNEMLRTLSPFVLSLVPPDAFPGAADLKQGASKRNPGRVFDQAAAGADHHTGRREAASAAQAPSLAADLPTRPAEFITAGKRRTVAQSNLLDPAIQDRDTARDILEQVVEITMTPPLVLLINPQELQVQFTKLQQHTEATRHGYIFQSWGEEEPKMSVTATVGAFYSAGIGLHMASRLDSAAWQNFSDLVLLYQNGACVYDRAGGSRAIHMVGAVRIDYDNWAYIGHMDSLSYGHEADKPQGGFQFTFEFTVSRRYDLMQAVRAVQPLRSPTSTAHAQPRPGRIGLGVAAPEAAPAAAPGDAGLTTQGFKVSRR